MPSVVQLDDGNIRSSKGNKFTKFDKTAENTRQQKSTESTRSKEGNFEAEYLQNGYDYNNNDQRSPSFKNGDSPYISNGVPVKGSFKKSASMGKEPSFDVVDDPAVVVNQFQNQNLETVNTDDISTDNWEDPSLAWMKNGKMYKNGPDQILPTTAIHTWDARGATKIHSKKLGKIENLKPISIPSLLKGCADRAPNKVALKIKRDGDWQQWTYKDYLADVRTVAKAFIALGLERYHSVCILGFNSPEWFLSDLGAIFAGGIAAGIYTTNGPESCAYCALDSNANIFVVEDEKQLAKVLEIRHQLPHLKAIIQYTGEPTEAGVLSWAQLMALGRQQTDVILEERLAQLAINQCCTLIYTSGTTGTPKAVMISHDNLTFMAQVNRHWIPLHEATDTFQEIIVSFLPLSHIAAQIADIYCYLTVCGAVTFADKNALKGSLVDNLKEAGPTRFFAVPRVWEKINEKMTEVGRSTRGLKKVIATWAKNTGLECNMNRMSGVANYETIGFKIAKKVVFSKVHEALGLTNCKYMASGAAPLSPDIVKFFMALNIIVHETYGMSESSGPHALSRSTGFRLGSVGQTMDGFSTKILNPDRDGNGEVLMGGRHVFMGYLNEAGKTKEALDGEGWQHSGDIGRVDADGFLFITGRLKEIIITAGGENVAPIPIEDKIKTELPCVSQAVVIGDKLRFLSVLLTFKTEINMNTQEALDTLTTGCKEWIEKNGGCSVSTLSDLLDELYKKENKQLIKAIQNGISRCNAQAVSRAQFIQKWVVLPKDFSIPGGELGPTMKLKRIVVYEKFAQTIADMYKDVQKE